MMVESLIFMDRWINNNVILVMRFEAYSMYIVQYFGIEVVTVQWEIQFISVLEIYFNSSSILYQM